MASQTGFFLILLFYSLEIVIFMVVYHSKTYFHSQHREGMLVTCAPLQEQVVPARLEIYASLILFISHSKTSKFACKEGNKDKQKTKQKNFLLKEWEGKNMTLNTVELFHRSDHQNKKTNKKKYLKYQ